ncbi:MAG: type IV pilus assembly protein PilM [Patescibacteria group bacterium]
MALKSSHAFGIDISDRTVEMFELKKKFKKFQVVSYGRAELRDGIVENGEVREPNELAEAIRRMLKQAEPKPPKTADVVLSVPESRTFIHTFRLPSVISEKNVGESVQFRAEETIPLSFDQVYYDYGIVDQTAEYREVLYVACYRGIVDGYRSAVRQAGLNPIVLEPESLALTRTVVRSGEHDAILMADVGARTTNVTIYDNGGIRYSSTLKEGGRTLIRAISEALGVDPARAEQLLRTVGLVREFKKGSEGAFQSAIEPLVEEIVGSIGRAAASYAGRTGTRVKQIILTGGVSLMPGFVAHVRMRFGENVLLSNPLEGLQYSSESLQKIKEPVLYGTAVGLALRGVDSDSIRNGINLYARSGDQGRVGKSMPEQRESKAEQPQFSRMGGSEGSKKRFVTMVVIFSVLVALFLIVLFLRPQFGDENVNYNVDYSAGGSPSFGTDN